MTDLAIDLQSWILDGEEWLIRRILMYAKRQGYAEYTSTLEEAWRLSIRELSRALTSTSITQDLTEFEADGAFNGDPVSEFATLEAHKHRERGIDLKMFLGLFKYYRQAYVDWVEESDFEANEKAAAQYQVTRIFDRMEIAFCSEWADLKAEDQLNDLRNRNREMTNEKNWFLTVTESLASPVILLDPERRITYGNLAAAPILNLPKRPGTLYYQNEDFELALPAWLDRVHDDAAEKGADWHGEYEHSTGEGAPQVFSVTVRPMLDVSDKFQGTVVILHDITALREAESALETRANHLERQSHTDSLTGLLNRRGLFARGEATLKNARRSRRSLSVLFGDVDDLKRINDRFGHSIGDRVLIALAESLRRSVRASDLIARIGGDEIVIILPDSGEIDRQLVKQRLQGHLADALADFEEQPRVSVSLGWVVFEPERHATLLDLLADADDSMYLAKQKRKSQLEAAERTVPARV